MQLSHRTAAVLLMAVTCFAPQSTAACEVHWALYPKPGCADIPPYQALAVPAGDYGVFYFSRDDLKDRFCANQAAPGGALAGDGIEYYPAPGSAPPAGPCAAGSCLTAQSAVQGPWVAVIDWDSWHGRWVGATALAGSDPTMEAALLPLEQTLPWTRGTCPGIGDHDVLIRLAELTELVDAGAVVPPRVVNMSFGRQVVPSDPKSRECTDVDELTCQLSRLLGHLAQPDPNQPPRTAVVAAAGNHRKILFPASLEHVIAAGSLDLLAFSTDGVAQPSWETPPVPNSPFALMPGSGLCLDEGVSGFPPPAGTSFASALFAGWLAEAWNVQETAVRSRLASPVAAWVPSWSCTNQACELVLTHGTETFDTPTGHAAALVAKALAGEVVSCGAVFGDGLSLSLMMQPVGDADLDPLTLESLSEEVADTHRPAPEPDPCVPCAISCHVLRSAQLRAPSAGVRALPSPAVLVTIDLHSSWALDPETTLEGVYLRIGSGPLQRVLFDADDWQLEALARGDVAQLVIKGNLPNLAFSEQPSLITLHRVLSTGALVWDSTPMVPGAP